MGVLFPRELRKPPPLARLGEQWRRRLPRSLQTRLALGYVCIIGVLLVLMNTYPLLMNQNLIFRAKQTALTNQAALVTNTLVTADDLTPEAVAQAVDQLEDLEVQRLVVTDEAGLVLYDTGEATAVGRYLLQGEVVSALEGNDAFSSRYAGGVIYSRFATPVMDRNQVAGAVYLYEEDSGQGTLLVELQRNLRLISVVVCLAVLVLFWAFSAFLSRRVNTLLGGIRTVRAGGVHPPHRPARPRRAVPAGGGVQPAHRPPPGHRGGAAAVRLRRLPRAEDPPWPPSACSPTPSSRMRTSTRPPPGSSSPTSGRPLTGSSASARSCWSSTAWTKGGPCSKKRWTSTPRWGRRPASSSPWPRARRSPWRPTWSRGAPSSATRRTPCRSSATSWRTPSSTTPPQGRVWVTTRRVGDRVRLEVADTGVGIPPEDMPKIFQRFYRVDKARSRAAGGTGLGLSIARDAVRRHGGEIAVAPREGGGTLFTVTFRVGEGGEPA